MSALSRLGILAGRVTSGLATSTMRKHVSITESPGFILMHLACLLVVFTGWSWVALLTCFFLYLVRMIGITVGYHRYFSHRSYKTSRLFQFALAWLGASAAQQGPLWWAAHHRHHHRYSDTENDVHSPIVQGFWWSHMGWIMCRENKETNYKLVPDLMKYPELRFLNRFYLLPPTVLGVALWLLGAFLGRYAPYLGVSKSQLLVWGLVISTVLLYHGTFTVNSLAHKIGRRRFDTGDGSRNSVLVTILTLGEGWHNNHHFAPQSERQGFYWWEIDISHYILKALGGLGIVWDLRSPPVSVYERAATSKTGLDRNIAVPKPSA